MKIKDSLKRLCCLMLSAIFLVLSGAESVQAATTTGITLNTTDFKTVSGTRRFENYAQIKHSSSLVKAITPDDGRYSYQGAIPVGATVYLTEVQYCTGQNYYIAVYKGKAYYVSKKLVTTLRKLNRPKRKTKDDVVKQQGLVGDVLKGGDYAYIYSFPDDSKPENGYAHVPAGQPVQIIDKNYNKDWMKILCNNYYVCYIKKEDVKIKDAYLIGARYDLQPYIKLAKKAKLTYSGILKDYDKELTKKEFCRLAVLWYQAMGNKLPKQKTKSPFKDTKDKYVIMAHQLGIIESTSNKKFLPNEIIMQKQWNKMAARLMEVAKAPAAARAAAYELYAVGDRGISRDVVITNLYKTLVTTYKTGYLIDDDNVAYMIMPFDNQNVCLYVWNESHEDWTTIGLWDCKSEGNNNQKFGVEWVNGFYSLKNVNSRGTLTSAGNGVVQSTLGNRGQKLTFEYNKDGSICIKNEDGLYLDIKDGTAVAGGELIFREKSGSSSQKFVFKAFYLEMQ